jgi:hypothetical protein
LVLTPPLRWVRWKRSWRVIEDRYPRIDIYERISDSPERPPLNALESLYNPRLRQERNEINILRRGDRFPSGPSSYNIRAAFNHAGSSRFSDGSFGAYYAAKTLETAMAEKSYATSLRMRATAEPPMPLRMRVIVAGIRARLHDIRGWQGKEPSLYSKESYTASQAFGRALWSQESEGLVYDSVRHSGGECIAIFRPQTIHHCRQERCLEFHWNGQRIDRILPVR